MNSNEKKTQAKPVIQGSKSKDNGNIHGNTISIIKGKLYNHIIQLIKSIVAISLLISILATIAMLADIYFNNSFTIIKNAILNQTHLDHTYILNDEHRSKQTINTKKLQYREKRAFDEQNERVADIEYKPIFEIFDDEPDIKKEIKENIKKHNEVKKHAAIEKKAIEKNIKSTKEKELVSTPTSPVTSTIKVKSNRKSTILATASNLPMVAIIIDDMGFDYKLAEAISRIDRNLTLSILPGSPYGRQIALKLHAKNMEIMLHQPMEPLQYPSVRPGYGALMSNMTPDEISLIVNKNLDDLPHAVGINNHMGSKFTTLQPSMNQVFKVLKERGFFFIDSLTSNHSAGRDSAEHIELPFASRDVFLDNIKDKNYVRGQLKELKKIAIQNGRAIAIGHPYQETYIVLKEEIPALKKHLEIVPVSQLVEAN